MDAHPDFVNTPLPRHAQLGPFTLDVLTPQHVQEDFEVVVESADVLQGLFGDDWPTGLTLEDNLRDLQRHAEEFDACFAFAWIIRSSDGQYLGCAYLNPTPGVSGAGKVVTWIRAGRDRVLTLDAFNTAFRDWLDAHLPTGFSLEWVSNGTI